MIWGTFGSGSGTNVTSVKNPDLIYRKKKRVHLKTIQTCRACSNKNLIDVLSLGDQFLQGSFVKGDFKPPTRKIPLLLTLCDAKTGCGLLQLRHSVPQEILYRKYWYRSGTNQTMKDHLKAIVDDVCKHTTVDDALDIGCNDGTLLSNYATSVNTVGVDPGDHLPDCKLFVKESFPSLNIPGKFDVITSIACFYDLEDPITFARCVGDYLKPDGVWILEVAYLPAMLRNNAYDNICHEHLEYYSLATLEYIVRQAGLKVVRASLNDINCGSIELWVTHSKNKEFDNPFWLGDLNKIRDDEFDMSLDTISPYDDFNQRSMSLAHDLLNLLHDLKKRNKTVHIYGASTKGNTILQVLARKSIDPINELLPYAADRNPEKWGAMTLGTQIPIISEEESRAMKPDYYLVLPWGFREEFIAREKNSGIKLIFPLPKLEII